jgi:hypothetical protein
MVFLTKKDACWFGNVDIVAFILFYAFITEGKKLLRLVHYKQARDMVANAPTKQNEKFRENREMMNKLFTEYEKRVHFKYLICN